jgi:Kef-type K+ transport system membrane component KefB
MFMKIVRPLAGYIVMIILFGSLIFFIFHADKSLTAPVGSHRESSVVLSHSTKTVAPFSLPVRELFPRLLLQIAVIIIVSRLTGVLFRKIGQPAVVGEVVAGIFLGPSLLGWVSPGLFLFLFPPASMNNLRFFSQFGLIIFMFIIGMELDWRKLRHQAFEAVFISHASIIIPYSLGIGLSFFIYRRYGPPDIGFVSFALFMGIAMSITAFPVLARIIRDKGWMQKPLGILALTCAASDDVTAWCLLALLVTAIGQGSATAGFFAIVLVILFILFMAGPVRWLLKKTYSVYERKVISHATLMGIVFIILLLSSWCTEVLGIHALFGAFLAGLIMPENITWREKITGQISDLSLIMLLPLFFVFTGLRTEVGLLNQPSSWTCFLLILIVAVLGKFGGSAIAARWVGHSWKDSLSIGAMMNTRGLMEMIVLNIGYDLGILNRVIFTMMVLMALVTTMMTNPVLTILQRGRKKEALESIESL